MPHPRLEKAPTTARELILALYDVQAVRLDGPFTLKSGLSSPIYIDLRCIISFPALLQAVCQLLSELVSPLSFSLICGVPYTALPIATLLSAASSTPMLMRRKEAKAYGTKRSVEGSWDSSRPQRCLIVEDLVTSGLSVFETVRPIQQLGVQVQDVVVVLDREQGGRQNIEQRGCRLHSLLTVSQLVQVLVEERRVEAAVGEDVMRFIRTHRMQVSEDDAGVLSAHSEAQPTPAPAALPSAPLSYLARAALCKNAVARSLFTLMEEKRTNLCLSADVTSAASLLRLADACGPHIALLKTHIDIVSDFTPALITELQSLASRHRFLLFEDRKFADIGSTVSSQYHHGLYRISSWAHIVNAHPLPGPAIVDGLSAAADGASALPGSGLLLIAQMSSAGNLLTAAYTAACVGIAAQHPQRVIGFICQEKIASDPSLLHMTPGVQRGAAAGGAAAAGDGLGQQYNSVDDCVSRGADVLIVGRGIYGKTGDEAAEAARYREEGWAAYERRLTGQHGVGSGSN